MELLFSCVATVTMLVAFTCGFFVGRSHREKPLLPVEPVVPDKIKQLEYEADQKALMDCLNYSVDVAYGGGNQS